MSKTAAERQKVYRDKKRNAQPEQNVTKSPKRNARGAEAMHQLLQIPDGKWTSLGPQDAPQSTKSGAVVAEHPPRTKGTCIHCGRGPLGDITHYPDGSAICDKCKTEQRTEDVLFPGHRNIYSRPDGTRYLIDATRNRHEWPLPVASVRDLSDIDLQLRLKGYPGAGWINSPEHKEVLRRRRLEAAA